MPATIISNVIVFRARTILPSKRGTSIQRTPNKSQAPFNNQTPQIIRVGTNNEIVEASLIWRPLSKAERDQLIEDVRACSRMNLPLFWEVPAVLEENVGKNLWEPTKYTTSAVSSTAASSWTLPLFAVGNLNPLPTELAQYLQQNPL